VQVHKPDALFGRSSIIYATFFAETLHDQGPTSAQSGLAIVFGLQAIADAMFLYTAGWGFILSMVLFGTTAWGLPTVMAAAMSEVASGEGG
jgi:hypothetical protein